MPNVLRVFFFAIAMLIGGSVDAADWVAQTEKDVFTGRRFGWLTGGLSSELHLHVRCDAEGRFSLAILYQESDPAHIIGYPVVIAVRVDDGALRLLNATGYKQNERYAGFLARTDMKTLADILTDIRSAKQAVRIGVEIPSKNFRGSATLKIVGARKAVRQFTRACPPM